MLEKGEHLVSIATNLGNPQVFFNIPVCFWKIFCSPFPTLLNHGDPVIFFCEPQGGYTAAKTRADNNIIKIMGLG